MSLLCNVRIREREWLERKKGCMRAAPERGKGSSREVLGRRCRDICAFAVHLTVNHHGVVQAHRGVALSCRGDTASNAWVDDALDVPDFFVKVEGVYIVEGACGAVSASKGDHYVESRQLAHRVVHQ